MSQETSDKSHRKRKTTKRFGNVATLDDSESEHDISVDDSMEDQNYAPEKSPKIVATIKRPKLTKTAEMSIPIQFENFDENFTEIDAEKCSNLDELSSCEADHLKENTSVEHTTTLIQLNSKTTDSDQFANLRSDISDLKELLLRLIEKNNEISARLVVLERVHIESSQNENRRGNKIGMQNDFSRHESFIQSVGFPFADLRDLQKFEKDLSDFKFSASVVCYSLICRFYKIQEITFFHNIANFFNSD